MHIDVFFYGQSSFVSPVSIEPDSLTNLWQLGMLGLVRPLYVVALEQLNAHKVRSFAVDQLRLVESSMGIRQAGLLADAISRSFDGGGEILDTSDCTVPLMHFC